MPPSTRSVSPIAPDEDEEAVVEPRINAKAYASKSLREHTCAYMRECVCASRSAILNLQDEAIVMIDNYDKGNENKKKRMKKKNGSLYNIFVVS